MPDIKKSERDTRSSSKPVHRKNVATIVVPVNEVRLAVEAGVGLCHFINFINIIGTPTMSEGISLTLLTLCITTVSTLVQFQDEGRWQYSGNIFFNTPIVVFGLLGAFIIASSFTPALIPIIQNKWFAVVVSGAVTLRQFMHIKMLFAFFKEFKKKKGA